MGLLGWSIAIQKTEIQRLPKAFRRHAKMIRSRLSCTGTTL
jgi:hypothetical protein